MTKIRPESLSTEKKESMVERKSERYGRVKGIVRVEDAMMQQMKAKCEDEEEIS